MNKPYKGHDYLEKVYDNEVSIFLKSKLDKDPNSIFSKIILPYLSVSPSSENLVTDDLIINIKKIKNNIQNGNFEIAYDYLIKIENLKKTLKFLMQSFLSILILKWNYKNKMIYRLVSFVIQLLILITILTFIFTNPFIISIDISDYKYSFSFEYFFRSFTYVLITYLPNYIYIS